jgi:protein-S-isoprenylcysteine O-methyltransferase Ste14
MGRVAAVRFMGLYVPVIAAFLLVFLRPNRKRIFPAALLGFIWTLPSLLAVQLLNLHFGWWRFDALGGLFRGMPVDLYLGWAVLWGILPILSFDETGIVWVSAAFFGIDLILMPAGSPVVTLSHRWLIGEFVALGLVLVPAQLFARWTINDTRVNARAALHVLAAGAVFLFLIPEVVFAVRPGHKWDALLFEPAWLRSLELQAIALLGVVGVSAVQEFAQRGNGTPIPYDPPKQLVVSGLYRYISNPMQLSCALVMTAWGCVLRNPWVAAAGIMSLLYSLGLAAWDEGEDMRVRFGKPWEEYRNNVKAWRPRLTPWHAPDRPLARLYVAETCGPCSEVRRWFESHGAVLLHVVAAEDHPTRDLQRITYDPMDGSDVDEGVGAFARGLEHINLGWAFAGACLRLPGIKHLVQILLDGSGLGPRSIPRRSCKQPLAALGPSCSVGTASDDQSVHIADRKFCAVTNLPHEPRNFR